MRSVLEAGFIFWGLFLVFGLTVAGYIVWMWWVEREDDRERGEP
jgi:phage shock protein PspC (stress-responsive transcriptional regulator)